MDLFGGRAVAVLASVGGGRDRADSGGPLHDSRLVLAKSFGIAHLALSEYFRICVRLHADRQALHVESYWGCDRADLEGYGRTFVSAVRL
jgi:hypothetical protein